MFKSKKAIAVLIAVLVLAISATALAATYSSPAEMVAALIGKTKEEVIAERTETGKAYGTIANDAGKLEEFKAAMFETKKAVLKDRVESGRLTQEQADALLKAIEENQATCDGTGGARVGREYGAGFGMGSGSCGGGTCQGSGQFGTGMRLGMKAAGRH